MTMFLSKSPAPLNKHRGIRTLPTTSSRVNRLSVFSAQLIRSTMPPFAMSPDRTCGHNLPSQHGGSRRTISIRMKTPTYRYRIPTACLYWNGTWSREMRSHLITVPCTVHVETSLRLVIALFHYALSVTMRVTLPDLDQRHRLSPVTKCAMVSALERTGFQRFTGSHKHTR
jgi:hypothetical protein